MNSFEILGFLSACMALVAFIGIEYGEFHANTFWYDWLNLVSSVGLIIYALSIQGWPFVLTNSVWAIISALDLLKISRRKGRHRRSRRN